MSDFLAKHYTPSDFTAWSEDNRLDTRVGQVEFLTTCRFIDRYLQPGARILEVGAASGKYSHHYARQGYQVDAVDIVPFHVEKFRAATLPGEMATITLGDARDLSAFGDGVYDVTLILGPLYHLFTEADKKQVIAEALRVTKPGGVLFAAYCISDASLFDQGFKRQGFSITEMIRIGLVDPVTFRARSNEALVFELVRKEDIDALMAGFPVRRLHYVATDLYAHHMIPELNAMTEEMFALYLRYHFSVCERGDMAGLSHHVLDVFRKEGTA
ncbi:MAG: class I SAM-dependent methyltransferase [Oscillospiraceae bacterium]|jgi:SAM-dependent methyltransferase|nr:class I SAM-dependent methyltransferase [Oscillospiraceae bacterium]